VWIYRGDIAPERAIPREVGLPAQAGTGV
jgi:hypothetical protein